VLRRVTGLLERHRDTLLVVLLVSLATMLFRQVLSEDWNSIFQQAFHGWDEAVNSAVSANLTRRFFPAMVRLHSLYGPRDWAEGPYWLHIPPPFAYVPWLFFKLDGQVTIEMKRLSYAALAWVTALAFIWIVHASARHVRATLAAGFAAMAWLCSPFTRALIRGDEFGASDLLLAFCSVVALGALLSYGGRPREERLALGWRPLLWFAALTVSPFVAKSVLGALPVAFLFGWMIWDARGFGRVARMYCAALAGLVAADQLVLYLSDPETYRAELLMPFAHVTRNFENWQRPWDFFFTDYLPKNYLAGHATLGAWVFLCAAAAFLSRRPSGERAQHPQNLAIAWFVANLIVVSAIRSKAPNFIFQSWLFALFFAADSLAQWLLETPWVAELRRWTAAPAPRVGLAWAVGLSAVFFALRASKLTRSLGAKVRETRARSADSYPPSPAFAFAEQLRHELGARDLVLYSGKDAAFSWFRYPVLFVTGTETRVVRDLNERVPLRALQAKYDRIEIVFSPGETPPPVPAFARADKVGDYARVVVPIAGWTEAWVAAHAQALAQLPGFRQLLGVREEADPAAEREIALPQGR
jgi:hypothetical protein